MKAPALSNPSAGSLGNHLSLFSGIGATDLAVEAVGWKTVATAEIDPWCRRLLTLRYPDAAHFPDVRAIDRDSIDATGPLLISGGFPCQGIAGPGTGAGLKDPRSGLWAEFYRIIQALHPTKVLIENSPMLRTRGLSQIVSELSLSGYDSRWDCIPAASVGAPHLRDRIYIVAEPNAVGPRFVDITGHPSRAGQVVGGRYKPLTPLATIKQAKKMSVAPRMYPTPTLSDGTGGPGATPKRTGGKNLRTVINELEGNGRLNPVFVEWMMGLPLHWTDTSVPNSELSHHPGWMDDVLPRTVGLRTPDRAARIKALGNSLVPQAALVALTSYRKENDEKEED